MTDRPHMTLEPAYGDEQRWMVSCGCGWESRPDSDPQVVQNEAAAHRAYAHPVKP